MKPKGVIDDLIIATKYNLHYGTLGTITPQTVSDVLKVYKQLIPKFGLVQRAYELNDPFMDRFKRESYLIFSEVQKRIGINKFKVQNLFRMIFSLIDSGIVDADNIDPKMESTWLDTLENIKNQVLLTTALVAVSVIVLKLKK